MENKPTILSLFHQDIKLTAELDWDADIDQIMDALEALLIGVGFHKDALSTWKAEEQQ
jgi:hypothetical protein